MMVQFDSMTPARPVGEDLLWSNSIIGWIAERSVEGVACADWVVAVADRLGRRPDFLWGAAFLRSDFHRTNIDSTSGMRPIGRVVRRHLPGLYWLNLFGPAYVDLIGTDRLLTTDAAESREIGQSVMVRSWDEPEDGDDALRRHLTEQLG